MRIIPINSSSALFVLKEMAMSETMNLDGFENDLICRTSSNEIVLYRPSICSISNIEGIEEEIERSDPENKWVSARRQEIHNRYFREAKSIMIGYIREDKIDVLLKEEDEGEYMWC